MKKRQESNQEGLEMGELSLLQQASPVRSVPLIERLNEAKQLVPLTARNQRRMPHVSIYSNGQGHFSNAFNPLLGKSKSVPLGTHRYLTFHWDLDAEKEQLVDYNQEEDEPIYEPMGVLFVQFSDTDTDYSIEIKSRYPRNVVGLQPIMQRVKALFGDEGFPAREVDKDGPAKFYRPYVNYNNSGKTVETAWDIVSWRPPEGERYLFCDSTLEIDVENRACAMHWFGSIITKVEKKAPTDDFDDSEISTTDADISSGLGGNEEGESTTS